ncbi:hypothetical protein Y1Q_0022434 [Alligator mississippiensis]|uniref:Uncharacterized protein n=1 Tax=Alligator mississippiensis TaxID=8496 RepID=A0A151N0E7_ALLMI|nr:hypothetical protein Y1Q_0022434 [Alligator mississippiensis]
MNSFRTGQSAFNDNIQIFALILHNSIMDILRDYQQFESSWCSGPQQRRANILISGTTLACVPVSNLKL